MDPLQKWDLGALISVYKTADHGSCNNSRVRRVIVISAEAPGAPPCQLVRSACRDGRPTSLHRDEGRAEA